MNADTQSRVISNLAFSLNVGGSLVLGQSEMLFSKLRSFVPSEIKRRVFVRVDEHEGRDRMIRGESGAVATVGERLAFDLGPVAQILIGENGTLTHVNRRARELLALRSQDVGRDLERLAIAKQPVDLGPAIEQAHRIGRVIGIQDVAAKTPDGHEISIDVHVVPLRQDNEHVGTIVTFTDVTSFHQLRSDVARSNLELATAMEELQSTNEELETTNEELQSTNEELETTNEELQSTNEELETTNEELQSTNEELETLNEEMSERTLEVAESNRFMDTVLSGLRASVIVLGPDLRVRNWNSQSEDLWGVRESEVRGRLLPDVEVGLPMDLIHQRVRACLLGSEEPDLVVDAINRRGQPIRCRISCERLGSDGSRDSDGVVVVIRETGAEELTTLPVRR
jgi:two-component system CheB/CheR fusion protein